MKQVYHHYLRWEDFKNGMWRKEVATYEEKELPHIIKFTGDYTLYGQAMRRVVHEWPISCEHNLSNMAINRKAWLGHAACCLEHGWPEYMVRQAWGMLTEDQRIKANQQADAAIKMWERLHMESKTNFKQLLLWNNA